MRRFTRREGAWHVEQTDEHAHEGVRALHAAAFELDAVEAASSINSRHGSKTTRDFVERIDRHPLSALTNIEMAREKLRQRTGLEQILPTSNFFKGTTRNCVIFIHIYATIV